MSHRFFRQLELHARYAVIGQLAEGRRVLDLGCGDDVALAQLLLAGAQTIVLAGERAQATVADVDAETRRRVEAADEPTLPLGFTDGAFDLIICHDLADRLAQDERWIPELRRVLVADGYLLLAVANPEGRFLSEVVGARGATALDYGETTDRLADVFGTVTVLGQSPMVASLFFGFEDAGEEPGLSLDPALLPEDEDDQPGWFLLLCGPEPVNRDDLAIVQIPFAALVQGVGAQTRPSAAVVTPPGDTADPAAIEAQLAQSQQHTAALQGRLAELEAASGAAAEQATHSDAQLKIAHQKIAELETAMGALAQQQQQLEDALRDETRRRGAADEELLHAQRMVQSLEGRAQQAELRLQGLQDGTANAEGIEQCVQDATQRCEEGDRQIAALEGEVSALQDALANAETRVEALTALQSHGETVIAALEDDLRQSRARLDSSRAEHVARQQSYRAELLRGSHALEQTRVEAAEAASQAAGLSAQLEELQAQLAREKTARRQAELRSADHERALRDAEARATESLTAATVTARAAEARLREAEEQNAARLRHAEGQAQEALRKVEKEAAARLEEAQAEHAECLHQAEARIQEAAARCVAAERRLQQSEQSAAARLQAEQQTHAAAEAACQQAQAAAVAERQRAEECLAQLQALQAGAGHAERDTEHDDTRARELEEDLQRQHSVRAALEEQVLDLMEEVLQLRGAVGQPSAATAEVDALRRQLAEEQARFAQLVSELAQVKEHLGGVEAQRLGLAAEAQRLTDALHEQRVKAARRQGEDADQPWNVAAADTGQRLATPAHPAAQPRELEEQQLAAQAQPAAAGGTVMDIPVAVPVVRDAVGREIDGTLAGLEDLIDGSVKSSPN